jgi:hypothetical protein
VVFDLIERHAVRPSLTRPSPGRYRAPKTRFSNAFLLQLFFHGTKMSSLHKHLDVNTLPEDYGGKKPKLNYSSADWYPVMSDLQNHIAGKWCTAARGPHPFNDSYLCFQIGTRTG